MLLGFKPLFFPLNLLIYSIILPSGNLYSAKPGFFHEDSRANLFEVERDTGMLVNTDNGSPMAQVDTLLFVIDVIFLCCLLHSINDFFILHERLEILILGHHRRV